MKLIVAAKGSGKYVVTDQKSRTIYTVGKTKKLFGNPITTLYDASGYSLYTMQKTASGKKPTFRIDFNDAPFMTAVCKSIYLDPSLIFEGQGIKYNVKSKDRLNFEIIRNGVTVGKMETEKQTNGDQLFAIEIDDKSFDDYVPFFAVCADKSFRDLNK